MANSRSGKRCEARIVSPRMRIRSVIDVIFSCCSASPRRDRGSSGRLAAPFGAASIRNRFDGPLQEMQNRAPELVVANGKECRAEILELPVGCRARLVRRPQRRRGFRVVCAFEEIADRNVHGFRQPLQTARAYANDALLVFLQSLEADADTRSELHLGEAEKDAAHAYARSHIEIDGVRPMYGGAVCAGCRAVRFCGRARHAKSCLRGNASVAPR